MLYKIQALTVFAFDIGSDLVVSNGVKVLKSEIFQLLLYLLHTESVSQGSINVHGLKGSKSSLVLFFSVQSSHVMKSVTELDKDNSYVL